MIELRSWIKQDGTLVPEAKTSWEGFSALTLAPQQLPIGEQPKRDDIHRLQSTGNPRKLGFSAAKSVTQEPPDPARKQPFGAVMQQEAEVNSDSACSPRADLRLRSSK